MNPQPAVQPVSPGEVLADIAGMLRQILDEYGLADAEIAMTTRFHDDLEIESVDMVALAAKLNACYGERVNFAEFIAGLDINEIIELDVGRLVHYVVGALDAKGSPPSQLDEGN